MVLDPIRSAVFSIRWIPRLVARYVMPDHLRLMQDERIRSPLTLFRELLLDDLVPAHAYKPPV
ncbi:MAG: hypothetical protein B7Y12_00755 [Rhizobiales bacterium 24-66-13]|nr:MAG: hypothetical protein B7Y95_04085 [Rhizobiales bacterium 32-66-11]OYY14039.1 MAG: hypothetical protein B7Y70_00235 [Rhizobiales bacterium 35-68-8]OYZ83130.1 MAG: hypothetical protein B7Y12_00755 [Rhizobiales bacterium 24-66-13]OZB12060.1 MAG: hypothetical protein B7X67_01340 [Rhizobiales bacterium 39-66-18]